VRGFRPTPTVRAYLFPIGRGACVFSTRQPAPVPSLGTSSKPGPPGTRSGRCWPGRAAGRRCGGVSRPTLHWPGRGTVPLLGASGYTLAAADDPACAATATLTHRRNVGDPTTENLLVTGEARDALRAVVADSTWGPRWRSAARVAYLDPPFNTGRRFARYDDALPVEVWLSLFETRLEAILPLLRDDATIWVHLDEAHVHHARCILDEQLGADCYLRTVSWQRKNKPGPSTSIAASCDFLLVYGRRPGIRLNRIAPSPTQLGRYANPDSDPAGPWIRRHDGGRRYLSEFVASGAVPHSLWPRDEVGDNETGTRELTNLFGSKVFDTPKPEALLQRVLTIASDRGDAVVDPFAGSGTTAAVALKLGRRFLAVELNATTVTDVTAPRLEKVVTGADPGGVSRAVNWSGGGGFHLLRVATRRTRLRAS